MTRYWLQAPVGLLTIEEEKHDRLTPSWRLHLDGRPLPHSDRSPELVAAAAWVGVNDDAFSHISALEGIPHSLKDWNQG